MPGLLRIATSQFPVSGSITSNLKWMTKHILQAHEQDADIVHFSECALSGYASIDFDEVADQNAADLQIALNELQQLAAETSLWLIVGSHEVNGKGSKPANSLYLIDDKGKIHNRYDKRLLTGSENEEEKKYYRQGTKKVVFAVKGIRCGLLICHEWRYTELYRDYKSSGVELVFQSFYDGKLSRQEWLSEGKEMNRLLTGTMKGNAANNYLWISVSNTSRRESNFPSMLIRPDGYIANKCSRNRAGLLISDIDTSLQFVDPSAHNRASILNKIHH